MDDYAALLRAAYPDFHERFVSNLETTNVLFNASFNLNSYPPPKSMQRSSESIVKSNEPNPLPALLFESDLQELSLMMYEAEQARKVMGSALASQYGHLIMERLQFYDAFTEKQIRSFTDKFLERNNHVFIMNFFGENEKFKETVSHLTKFNEFIVKWQLEKERHASEMALLKSLFTEKKALKEKLKSIRKAEQLAMTWKDIEDLSSKGNHIEAYLLYQEHSDLFLKSGINILHHLEEKYKDAVLQLIAQQVVKDLDFSKIEQFLRRLDFHQFWHSMKDALKRRAKGFMSSIPSFVDTSDVSEKLLFFERFVLDQEMTIRFVFDIANRLGLMNPEDRKQFVDFSIGMASVVLETIATLDYYKWIAVIERCDILYTHLGSSTTLKEEYLQLLAKIFEQRTETESRRLTQIICNNSLQVAPLPPEFTTIMKRWFPEAKVLVVEECSVVADETVFYLLDMNIELIPALDFFLSFPESSVVAPFVDRLVSRTCTALEEAIFEEGLIRRRIVPSLSLKHLCLVWNTCAFYSRLSSKPTRIKQDISDMIIMLYQSRVVSHFQKLGNVQDFQILLKEINTFKSILTLYFYYLDRCVLDQLLLKMINLFKGHLLNYCSSHPQLKEALFEETVQELHLSKADLEAHFLLVHRQ